MVTGWIKQMSRLRICFASVWGNASRQVFEVTRCFELAFLRTWSPRNILRITWMYLVLYWVLFSTAFAMHLSPGALDSQYKHLSQFCFWCFWEFRVFPARSIIFNKPETGPVAFWRLPWPSLTGNQHAVKRFSIRGSKNADLQLQQIALTSCGGQQYILVLVFGRLQVAPLARRPQFLIIYILMRVIKEPFFCGWGPFWTNGFGVPVYIFRVWLK